MNKNIPYDLLAKYVSLECTADEKSEAEAWISQSEENRKVVNEMKYLWESKANRFEPDSESALKKVHRKMETEKTVRRVSLTQVLRIAAAIFIAGGLFWIIRSSFFGDELIAETNTAEQPKEILLPDGTKVWLNQATTLEYAKKQSAKERKVTLTGEAYFEVTKNPERPFIIETNNSEIKVLGTSFNVKAFSADSIVKVSVTEGLVSFSLKEKKTKTEVKLAAGETGTLNREKKNIRKQNTPDANYMSWKSGELVFDGTPLEVAVKELSSFYHIKIEIADSSLKDRKLRSRFKKDRPEALATGLQSMGKIEIKDDGTIIILTE
jgi:transmembrane sensor